jgi:5'-nucleotidase
VLSPRGEKHFWIGGGVPFWEHGEDIDITAVEEGFVSVTPVHLDFTNHSALRSMREDRSGLLADDDLHGEEPLS